MDFAPTGIGAVCYRKAEGPAFLDAEERLVALLDSDEGPDVERVDDSFGFTWLVVRTEPVDPGALVTDLHAVNSTLEAEGFASGLLCRVVGFRDRAGRTLGLVYRYATGSFYPFAPVGAPEDRQRESLLEMQVRTSSTHELPVEPDLAKWMPSGAAPPSVPRTTGGSVAVALAGEVQHPLEGDLGPVLGVGVDLDHVDRRAVGEALQRPDEVREVDPVHRRAVADGLVQEHDPLVRVLRGQPLDQVELGADRPGGAGRCGLDWS